MNSVAMLIEGEVYKKWQTSDCFLLKKRSPKLVAPLLNLRESRVVVAI